MTSPIAIPRTDKPPGTPTPRLPSDGRSGTPTPRRPEDFGGPAPLDPAGQSAYDVLVAMLREWGLEALAPEVLRLLQEGRSREQVSLLLQDTETYKQRFAGNEARRKAGLAVLAPREYLATEAAYRQVMESAGLPKGFYDSPSDFSEWIGADVSASEIRERVDLAVSAAERLDAGTQRAFRDFYGIGAGELAAFFLDRDRAMPQLNRIARGARIGGAGFNQGVKFDRLRAEQLAASDLTDNQLEGAVGRVGTLAQEIGKLGNLYGEDFGQREAEQEVFFADEAARRKRERLSGREVGEFSGSSGVGRGSLSSAPSSY